MVDASGVLRFRDDVLAYLREEKDAVQADIDEHKLLTPEEQEDIGLLIRSAKLIKDEPSRARYAMVVNWTKLRPGDEVRIVDLETGRSHVAYVDENGIEEMSFTFESACDHPSTADVVVVESNMLKQAIALVASYRLGAPGLAYLKLLANVTEPRMVGARAISDVGSDEIPSTFNDGQRQSVLMAVRRPSIAYVQGTPGSGKTHLLSVIARIYARRSMDVVVMALTHQAVNNALNKIAAVADDVPVAKVGKLFKNVGLRDSIVQAEDFKAYLAHRRETGRFVERIGRVVGMTYQAALTNLGAIKSAFIPQVILFDEAGQLPLTHAAAIGTFHCGSVVFIGDDAQMPPIYHEKLIGSPFSVSVFEHLKKLYPSCGTVLDVTYRMNTEITRFVGDRYYQNRGVNLISDSNSIGNVLAACHYPWMSESGRSIEFVLCENAGATDENRVEAAAVVALVKKLLGDGLAADRIAVITPYRRQSRLVSKILREEADGYGLLPLIDTVERLQGQDVDVLIATFATDNTAYFVQQQSFLMNPNRLNVMFSRATSRVVVFGSAIMRDMLAL